MSGNGETVFDRYYVCDFCAHTWSEPEPPSKCENCRKPGHLTAFDRLEDAERYSQAIVDYNRA